MHTRRRRRLLHLGLATLLLGTGTLRGSVLCIGAGGHFAIEAVDATCCRPAVASTATAASLTDGCASDCTDTDLRLPAATDKRVASGRDLAPALPAALVVRGDRHGEGLDGRRSVTAFPAPPGPAPRQLRTTVNLC